MKITIVSIFFFYLCLQVAEMMAQPQDHLSKFIDISDGLPSNKVYRVTQTRDGFYWFATEAGLVKYDGETMTVFDAEDGLPNDDVFMMHEDRSGRLWVFSVSSQLAYIRNDSVFVIDAGSDARLRLIWEDDNGSYFTTSTDDYHITNDDQVYKYKKHTVFQSFFHHEHSPDEPLNLDVQGKIQNVIIKGDTIDVNETYSFGFVQQQPFSSIPTVLSTRNGFNNNYMLDPGNMGRHIFIFNRKAKNLTELDVNTPSINPHDLLVTNTLDNGFLLIRPNDCIVMDSALNMIDTIVMSDYGITDWNSVFFDHNNNMWVSSNKGIQVVFGNSKALSEMREYDEVDYTGIKMSDSQLIVWTSDDVYVQDLSLDSRMLTSLSGDLGGIYSVLKADRKLYVSSRKYGVQLWNLQTGEVEVTQSRTPVEICDNLINRTPPYYSAKYCVKDQDRLVVAGTSLSIWDLDLKSFCSLPFTGYFFGADYVALDSSVWICGKNHTVRISTGLNDARDLELCTKPKEVFPLDSVVVTKSFDSRIGYWRPKEGYKEIEGLRLSLVGGEQYGDDIYLITEEAIYHLDLKTEHVSRLFDLSEVADGIRINATERYQSQLYLATTKGILKYDLTKANTTTKPIELAVTSHQVDCHYEYEYANNSTTFSYTPIYLGDHDRISYEYRLSPLQNEFESTTNKELVFNLLPPNDYQFEVRTVDKAGLKGEVNVIKFAIDSPWYYTTWFYLVFLVACLMLVWFLVSLYLSRVARKARLDHRLAELELNALQSQMNPHFVFNALNSIQNLIGRNETEKADAYVAKFAYVMRQFLEISKTKFIPLSREIEITKAYLELEMLRFGGRLSYDILIEVSDAQYQTLIPATLVQPFVENSIVHGIFHKKGEGKITIIVGTEKEDLKITIRDNGIGLAASAKLKHKHAVNHVSRGKELITEKIEVLKKMTNFNVEVESKDISKGEETGTEVNIFIRNRVV